MFVLLEHFVAIYVVHM